MKGGGRHAATDDRRDSLAEQFLILGDEGAQLPNDERGLDRGDRRESARRRASFIRVIFSVSKNVIGF
jgi:hypothetical protein